MPRAAPPDSAKPILGMFCLEDFTIARGLKSWRVYAPSRRANRPAVLRLVPYGDVLLKAASAAFRSGQKAVETAFVRCALNQP